MLFTFIESALTFESLKTDDSSRENTFQIKFSSENNNNPNGISNEAIFNEISVIVLQFLF